MCVPEIISDIPNISFQGKVHLFRQSVAIIPVKSGKGYQGHLIMVVEALWDIHSESFRRMATRKGGFVITFLPNKKEESDEASLERLKKFVLRRFEPKNREPNWQDSIWDSWNHPSTPANFRRVLF
jgi:hypothetical protein